MSVRASICLPCRNAGSRKQRELYASNLITLDQIDECLRASAFSCSEIPSLIEGQFEPAVAKADKIVLLLLSDIYFTGLSGTSFRT